MAIFVEFTKNECIIQWQLRNIHPVCIHYENGAAQDGLSFRLESTDGAAVFLSHDTFVILFLLLSVNLQLI